MDLLDLNSIKATNLRPRSSNSETAFRWIRLIIWAGPRENSALGKLVEREKLAGPAGLGAFSVPCVGSKHRFMPVTVRPLVV